MTAPAAPEAAAPSYAGRMRVYFAQMLPLPVLGLLSGLTTLAIVAYARVVMAAGGGIMSRAGLASVVTVFATVACIYLMLRLMDDLKDEEIDRVLFPDRPLPSGRVRRADIERTLAGVMATYLLVSASCGAAFWSALGVLAYLLLMFRLFFVPGLLRRSLLLSFATHSPIVPLMHLQGFALCAHAYGRTLHDVDGSGILAFVGMLWAMSESWEVARKIRPPAQEGAYVTYSRILGPWAATVFVLALQGTSVLVAAALWRAFGLHWIYAVLVGTALATALAGEWPFLLDPAAGPPSLGPYARRFGLVFLLAQAVGFALVASPP